jgi:signal transduction protein with GAF and PtsI domain
MYDWRVRPLSTALAEPSLFLSEKSLIDAGYPSRSTAMERLGEIVISHSADPNPAHVLSDIACLIGNELRGDACSIYLFDQAREWLVLSGTVGLNQESIGKVRMSIHEGLTGLTAREKRPVIVPCDADQHPSFKYFAESGEDPYESFLGVPIVAGEEIIGVLVVQTVESRMFANDEVGTLVEHALAMGPLIRNRRP